MDAFVAIYVENTGILYAIDLIPSGFNFSKLQMLKPDNWHLYLDALLTGATHGTHSHAILGELISLNVVYNLTCYVHNLVKHDALT